MVSLRRWSTGDLSLLRLGNTLEMNVYLGGSEPDDVLVQRHKRYLRLSEERAASMYVIVDDGRDIGGIGWWVIEWNAAPAYETGWFVLTEAQGRGVARAALMATIEDVAARGDDRPLTAFPAVGNAPSNRLCEQTGFLLEGTEQWPFRGKELQVNAWVRR